MGSVYGPTVTLARITDGTSNTAIFSENLMGNSSSGYELQVRPGDSGRGVVLRHDNRHHHDVAADAESGEPRRPTCNTSAGPTARRLPALSAYSNNGFAWLASGNGEGGGYSHVQTPNLRNCWGSNQDTNSPSAYASNSTSTAAMITAKSNHRAE